MKSLIFFLVLVTALTSNAQKRELGASCAFDGQCLSRECKGFKCIPQSRLNKLGAACAVDGQCLSGECKGFKCVAISNNQGIGNLLLNALLNKFESISPIVEKAGFRVDGLNVELGLKPKVTVDITRIKALTRSEQVKMMKEYKGRIYVSAILKALFTAYSLKFDRYVVNESTLQLVPPKVTLSLDKK